MTVRWVPAEPGAQVVGLRWGYSCEKYESADFGTAEEAADYAQGDSFVEIVTLRNPSEAVITFEGRFLPEPAGALRVGAEVERVWYVVPGEDSTSDDFESARVRLSQMHSSPSYILEHLRLRQPDGQVVEQGGRILNLDRAWSGVSLRYADAYPLTGPRSGRRPR